MGLDECCPTRRHNRLGLAAGSLDLVFLSNVFHHLPERGVAS
jgi:hypothetical protein